MNTDITVGVACTTHCSDKINPKGHEALKLCLESFVDSIDVNFKFIIIDNSSTSKFSHSLLKEPNIHYHYIEDQIKNGGLTGAWNLGIRKCYEEGCDVILNSNDDIIFNPSINNFILSIFHCPFQDVSLFGPVCNYDGVPTPHQGRPTRS